MSTLRWTGVFVAALIVATAPTICGQATAEPNQGTTAGTNAKAGRCSSPVFPGGRACLCGASPREGSVLLDGNLPLNVTVTPTGPPTVKIPANLSSGPHSLTWSDGEGGSWKCDTKGARVAAHANATTLLPGQSARIELVVEGTDEPVRLRIVNQSPQVVSLRGGDAQTISTSGGRANDAELFVVGRRRGHFNLSYKVIEPDCPCGASLASTPGPTTSTPATSRVPGEWSTEAPVPVGMASGSRYRPCTKEEALEDTEDDALKPFLSDPQEARERQKTRRALAEESETVGYWQRLCERVGDEKDRADQNRERLRAIDDQVQNLADELGVDLPRVCSQEECCPDGSCCRGLDPENADDRETFQKRLKCLVDRFRSTNRSMQEAGSDFSWLYGRWQAGADHRAMMGFYDQLFSAISSIINTLTTSLGDRAKEVIERQLTSAGCSALGLSPEACQAARDKIQAAKDAKGAVDDVKSLIEADALPPAFIVKMVDAMAQAAGNAAHTAVEGWAHFKLEMGATLKDEYGRLLCLQEINEALARQATDCPRFCASAVEGIKADLEHRRRQLEAADRESRQRAASRLEAQEETSINPNIDSATSASDRAWAHACCQGGAGTVTVKVPGEEGELADCAGIVDGKLKQHMGPLYCYLWDLEVTVKCSEIDSIGEVTYTYGIEARRRPGCCLRRVDNE